MKKFFTFLFLPLLVSCSLYSQTNETIKGFESQLKDLMFIMFNAPTDNERFNANERFLLVFEEALSVNKSFSYPFSELDKISNLKSADNIFRIFTWAISSKDGSFEQFGFIQSKNRETNKYEVYRLIDKSDEILNSEYAKCDDENWFGAVYYDILTTNYDGKNYYTLLGFDANNIYTNRKIIEPISFKSRTGKPEFGASYFFKDRERKRYVFEYNALSKFVLKWDNQYYEDRTNRTSSSKTKYSKKKSSNKATNTPLPLIQEDMIVYEVLKPMFEGMEGVTEVYVASEQVNGFKFEKGKWRFIERVLARNKSNKMDNIKPTKKEFIPLYRP